MNVLRIDSLFGN